MNSLSPVIEDLQYVDAHCHVDLFPDPRAVMQEALEARVGVVAVTNTPSVFDPMVRLAEPFPNVFPAVGLHPELAIERESEVGLIPTMWEKTRFVGEIGLDGMARDPRVLARQQRVLAAFARCAAQDPSRVVTVHSRRAASEVLTALNGVSATVILHWFSGSLSQAREAAARGWMFSVNTAMLNTERGRALVASFPRDQVLTETDGPFQQVEGRPSRPVDVRRVVDGLGGLWQIGHEAARHQVMDNLQRCLRSE